MTCLAEAQALIKQVDQANKWRLDRAINTLKHGYLIKDKSVIADSEYFLSELLKEIKGE